MDTINNQKDATVLTLGNKIFIIKSVMPTLLGCCLFFLGAGNWSIIRG